MTLTVKLWGFFRLWSKSLEDPLNSCRKLNLGFAACPGNLWIMKKFRGQVGLKGALARNRMSSTSFKPGLLTSKYKGNKSKLRPPQFGLKRSYVREKNWSVTQIKVQPKNMLPNLWVRYYANWTKPLWVTKPKKKVGRVQC